MKTDSRTFIFEAVECQSSTDILPEMLVIAYDKESKAIRREAEAAVIAERILQLHTEEQISYKDMVILLGALTRLKVLPRSQQAGIPYTIVMVKVFMNDGKH